MAEQEPMHIPSSYERGYRKIRSSNPKLADRYAVHTLIGDPAADAVTRELACLGPERIHRHIRTCMDRDQAEWRRVPQVLRQFFQDIDTLPDWYRSGEFLPGCRLFHLYSDLFLTAFVGSVIIRGFTTLISLSFFATGRVMDRGVRRLRQNLGHLLEIMIPGGLDPRGDGWKLSVRIRLVHAQIRKLLAESGQWDTPAHGIPLSAAHFGYAAASFSAMMLKDAMRLGVKASAEERASFMHIWRCSAWLMGVPEEMLFRDENDALEIVRVALACEPPFEEEGIVMAHSLIHSAPIVVGIDDAKERARVARRGFRLARAMLGDETADSLRFPRYSTFALLPVLRATRRLRALRQRLPFPRSKDLRARNFGSLLDITVLDDARGGISYRLPDQLLTELSSEW